MKMKVRSWLTAAAALILAAALFMPVSATEVAGGSCGGGVNWSLDSSGVLTVSGTGAIPDYAYVSQGDTTSAPWGGYAGSVTSVVVGEGITRVGEFAFMNLRQVTSVQLPSTLIQIGGHAFQHMNGLTQVAFPEGLTTLGEYAFYGSVMSEVHLPNSLQSIACFAVSANHVYIDTMEHWLKLEFLPDSNGAIGIACSSPVQVGGSLYIGGNLLTHAVIPAGTTEIGAYRFCNVASITGVTIPDSVVKIRDSAFEGCTGLKSVTLPDSATDLETGLFRGCTSLTSAKLPEGIVRIPDRTFKDCVNLTDFTMPDSVRTIASAAFDGCANLTHFSSTNSLEKVVSIGDRAFAGCKKLQFGELKLSDELANMGSDREGYVFAFCEGITGVTIPGTLDSVPWTSFIDCVNLEQVVIKKGVTTIGPDAFAGCTKLRVVTLPDTVTKVGVRAFYECSALETVNVVNENCVIENSPWAATEYTLGDPAVTTIYCKPGSTAEAYAAANGFRHEELGKTCETGFHVCQTQIVQAGSCMEDGVERDVCMICGEVQEERVTHCTGHSLAGGVCEVCGAKIIAQQDTGNGVWALDADNTLTLSPQEMWEGEPWKNYAGQIEKVELPDSVRFFVFGPDMEMELSRYTVYPKLKTIAVGAETVNIWFRAAVPALTDFEIPQDNQYLLFRDGLLFETDASGYMSLAHCAAGWDHQTLRLPEELDRINYNALEQATGLQRLYFSSQFTPGSLGLCPALTDVYVLSSDYLLDDGPFEDVVNKKVFGDPAKVTVHGYAGSFAQQVAQQVGYTFVELTACDIHGHQLTAQKKLPATCVATGTRAHYVCSACGEVFLDQDGQRPAAPEDLVIPVDAGAHTGETEIKNAVEATCAVAGYTGDTCCTACGGQVTAGTVIEKLPHTLELVEKLAPTCGDAGMQEHYRCAVCQALFADPDGAREVTAQELILPADGTAHVTVAVAGVDAQCQVPGSVPYWHCEVCGKNYGDEAMTAELTTTEIPPLGHQWDAGVTADGAVTYHCLHCDQTKVLILPPEDMSVELGTGADDLESSVLTQEEQERVQQGEKADIYLEVSDITDLVSEEDKKLVEQTLDQQKVGFYLDLNLFKQLGEDRPVRVAETQGKITITISIPGELLADEAVHRLYQIVRIHEGVAELISGIFHRDTGTFEFETDRFSTYALVYTDTQQSVPTEPSAPGAEKTPEPFVWIGVAAAAVAAAVAAVLILRKKKKA